VTVSAELRDVVHGLQHGALYLQIVVRCHGTGIKCNFTEAHFMLGTELWSPNMQVSLFSKKNVVFLDATPYNVASFYRPIRGNYSVNLTAIFPIWLRLFTFVTYQ